MTSALENRFVCCLVFAIVDVDIGDCDGLGADKGLPSLVRILFLFDL